jgi:Tol biopolymer transport system component
MRKKTILAAGLLLLLIIPFSVYYQAQENSSRLKGPYLGQKPPGLTPVLFALGVVSTDQNEVNAVFTPDGKEFYFSRFDPVRGYTIMVMKEEEQGWSQPRTAPFSGNYSEVDMFITHDGKRFFFISKRPLQKSGPRSPGYQIWVMDRTEQGWANPRHLGPVVNLGTRQLYPTVSRQGTLYFNSNQTEYGKGDFFRSFYKNGSYTKPENLGEAINSTYDETDVLAAPDESFLIFTSVDRPDGYGSGDLYISFRRGKGSWTKAINMGETFNTSSPEFCPMLSPDGKYFFFTSRRQGTDDIYWVDAEIINRYKNLKN